MGAPSDSPTVRRSRARSTSASSVESRLTRQELRSMLDGVTRLPPTFAQRYRRRGYFEDRTLRDAFGELFQRYSERVCVFDGNQSMTYRVLDMRSTQLARHLLDLGLKPLDRMVVQLTN